MKLYLKRDKAGGCLKAGRFELTRAMSMPELLETMCKAPIADEVQVTFVEGWRMREIDAELSRLGLIEAGTYWAAAKDPGRFELPGGLSGLTSLEGLLLPESYSVPADGVNVELLIQRQIDLLNSRFVQPNQAAINASGRSLYELLIVASMLEREEPRPSNRPVVAGVMWKRLDNAWNLGIDATSRYTLADWNDRKAFLRQLRDPNDVYNTRLRGGLPPTPIGNAGTESLKAALSPEGTSRVDGKGSELGPVLKPTGFMTNSSCISSQLVRMCPRDHKHDHLVGGCAAGAAIYPPGLCRAICRGLAA